MGYPPHPVEVNDVATQTAQGVTSSFLNQGILGAVCLMFLAAACFFYLEKRKVETRERELYDRHLKKAEEWIEKYNEHASDMKTVLDSLSRRM
jgi:hypothetical protein